MELILTILPGTDLGSEYILTSNFGAVTPSAATYAELIAGLTIFVDDSSYFVTVQSQGTCTAELTLPVPDAVLYLVENVYSAANYSTLCSSQGNLVTNIYSSISGDTLRIGATYFFLTGVKFISSNYFANPQGVNPYGQFINGVWNEIATCSPVTTTTTTDGCVQLTNIEGYDEYDKYAACSSGYIPTIYGDNELIQYCTKITTSCGGTPAYTGYYYFVGHYRYWDGTSLFTGSGTLGC